MGLQPAMLDMDFNGLIPALQDKRIDIINSAMYINAVRREDQVLRHVVLPQALRIIVPPIGNQFVGMLRLSALVSVIAVPEIVLVAERTASANFRCLEALASAGFYYLALTTLLMALQAALERRLRRRGRKSARPGLTQLLLRTKAEAGRTRRRRCVRPAGSGNPSARLWS
jgi:Binding-protein-dependent transport system inner membrane component/Bacterial extracellular solute-binding proteins, family 3